LKIGKEDESKGCFDEGLKINPSLRSSLPALIAQAQAAYQVPPGKSQERK
jgi:hypothetical protein